MDNTIWKIGNGHIIKFWLQNYVPNLEPLINYALQPLSPIDMEACLNDFLTVQCTWDIAKFEEWLPKSICEKIMGLSPPSPRKLPDHLAWQPSTDGVFSIRTAYSIVRGTYNESRPIFRTIWTWQGKNVFEAFFG